MESKIVTAICQYLQFEENLGRLYHIRNNSGAYKVGNRFIRFGKAGSSDIIIFLPNGKTIFAEVKTEKGKQNKNQINFQASIEKLGFEYHIVRKPSDIEKLIK